MTILEAKNLNFSYGNTPILENISTSFKRSEMVGLTGPNSAGKSTLLKLLIRMLTTGHDDIQLQGLPLQHYQQKHLSQLMTVVPQDTPINYAFSVEDIIADGKKPLAWPVSNTQPSGYQYY